MKTRDLIAALNEADPSGELECCIANADIDFVDVEPAYYDGYLHVIGCNSNGDAISGEFRSGGFKVTLFSISIYEALQANPDLPITYDSESARRNCEPHAEAQRAKVRERNRAR